MIEAIIAERYARALLALAKEQGRDHIDRFGADLQAFSGFCTENKNLLVALADRYQDLFARERIVQEIAQKSGFDPLVANFLKLLVHKGRIALVAFVVGEYQKLAHIEMGRVVVKVVSAAALSDAQYQNILDTFSATYKKQMVLEKQILPSVIGGVRVHIGDRVYDATVRSQVAKLAQTMAAS